MPQSRAPAGEEPSEALLATFGDGVNVLTKRGGPRPRYRTYLALQERVERLVTLLKLDASGGKRRPVDPQAHLDSRTAHLARHRVDRKSELRSPPHFLSAAVS